MLEKEIEILQGNKIVYKQKSNSLLKQFFQALYTLMTNTYQTVTLVTGSTYATASSGYHFRNPYLVVGSSTQAVAYDNYKIISELSGVSYSNSQTLLSLSSSLCAVEIIATITNTESNSKTINEVAVYCLVGGTTNIMCIDRTVLTTPFVLDGYDSITLKYRLKQSF